ncbi:MAG: radical SAM protein [Candidatus Nezhaarchaeota archaeon]|nr:radical SAM protein [Candidatus Nezhaarchaeota archaeon]
MLNSSFEVKCELCGKRSKHLSSALRICAECIKSRFDEALPFIERAHRASRSPYGLPSKPPRSPSGVKCALCSNECSMAEGEIGYCGLRRNVNGKLMSKTSTGMALLYGYYDPHVTNCCASWFCPAATGAGYPRYAVSSFCEVGYLNYAVFFYGCNFNCLFCQNASHKRLSEAPQTSSAQLLGNVLGNERCTCVCFFGGSPEPQLPFAISVSRIMLEEKPSNRVLRICFEWNGCGNSALVKKAAELALVSGGNIKFDLKCFSEELSYALSGVPNKRAYENFEIIVEAFHGERRGLPLLSATTPLITGYVTPDEIEKIAGFIANLDPEIPYSLLVFHPDHYMSDMTITPRRQVEECLAAARRHLKRVTVGNLHLLNSF